MFRSFRHIFGSLMSVVLIAALNHCAIEVAFAGPNSACPCHPLDDAPVKSGSHCHGVECKQVSIVTKTNLGFFGEVEDNQSPLFPSLTVSLGQSPLLLEPKFNLLELIDFNLSEPLKFTSKHLVQSPNAPPVVSIDTL